jgi:hypothetical protein
MDELKEAEELYREAMDATRDQRRQIEEDLKFSDPSDPRQWDEQIKRQREGDPGGARPCLVMDHTGQYVANVAGQVNKSPPSIHTVPVGSGSDIQVSEQLDGILRHIEYASRAQTHYGIALTSAARTGVGYLIVRPEYTDRALGYQEPRISSEADPLRIVLDPWSVALDGSDADYGYKLTSLSEREFKRRWPKAKPVSFAQDEATETGHQVERKSIFVAEQWKKIEKTQNVLCWNNADGEEDSGSEEEYHAACQAAGMQLQYLRSYQDKTRLVQWRTLSGEEILETPKDADGNEAHYPADAIGIVPVYGYWGVKDGRMTYCGIPRRGRNPQRAYNYHASEMLAFMGQAPKSPFMAAVRAIKGLEGIWDRASVESRSYLPYNDIDDQGEIAAPARQNVAINLQNHMAGAEQALHDLEASIGMYQANLGAPSNEQSGVAIDARKEQGEASTSHFPQNLAASLGQVGRICVQMIPKLIDTKRTQRIMGIDMTPGSVTVDPQQQNAVQQGPQGLSINPNVGSYDVRVVVGASYSTQRSQAQEALAEVMRNNPDLTPAIAPLWAQNLDFPHADKLAQVLAAMAPPAVQAILNPDSSKQPQPEQLMQQNEQLKQGLQEAISHAHDAQAEADEAQDKLRQAQADKDVEMYNAETARLKVTGANEEQIKAIVGQLVTQMLSDAQRALPGDPPGGYPDDSAPPEGGELQQPSPQPAATQQPQSPPSAGFLTPEQTEQ